MKELRRVGERKKERVGVSRIRVKGRGNGNGRGYLQGTHSSKKKLTSVRVKQL